MFVYDMIKLLFLLASSYIIEVFYIEYLPVESRVSDWTMKLLYNSEAILISYISISVIFLLLIKTYYRIRLTLSKKSFNHKYKKSQALILLVIFIMLLFYLIYIFKIFLIPSFLTAILIVYLFDSKKSWGQVP